MAGGNVPAVLGSIFAAAGAANKIPPQVLAGIASVETNLGANKATSTTGAKGLMQFEPGTAAGLGVNVGNDRSEIYGAAKLLNQYGYQSNPLRAIGAYNGGPGNPQLGYANQVMSEANRLKGQLAPYLGGKSTMPGQVGATLSTNPGKLSPTPTSGSTLDQPAFNQAMQAFRAGSYLAKSGPSSNPYTAAAPKTGLESAASSNPLLTSGVLTTKAPNPADYQTAQQTLQKLAGNTNLNQHPTAFQANVKGSGYTNPLPGATWERTDMGVDASMKAGSPIRALGDSKVVAIRPNWYKGQPYVQFQLLNGPQAGKTYYIAEAINPTVRPGQTVRAGQTVGTFNPNGTGLELGWGTSGSQTLAQATTGYSEGQQTAAGKSFRNFLNGLGAGAG